MIPGRSRRSSPCLSGGGCSAVSVRSGCPARHPDRWSATDGPIPGTQVRQQSRGPELRHRQAQGAAVSGFDPEHIDFATSLATEDSAWVSSVNLGAVVGRRPPTRQREPHAECEDVVVDDEAAGAELRDRIPAGFRKQLVRIADGHSDIPLPVHHGASLACPERPVTGLDAESLSDCSTRSMDWRTGPRPAVALRWSPSRCSQAVRGHCGR